MSKNQGQRIVSWLGIGLVALFFLAFLRLPVVAKTPQHYTELELPPAPEVQLPEYDRYQLDNGMVVYLVEDRDLPLVKGTALIRSGSRWEALAQVGLAELTGEVMRSGGTRQHSPEELNLLLEQRAASVETSMGITSGSASFDTLSEDLDTVFNLFAEVIREPAFAPEKLELAKKQQQGAIARRNDDPGDIASREFNKLIYGQDSPYARTVEYETLDNIAREDIINFYNNYVRPESIILGIVGDFEPEKLKSLIENAFGDWQVKTTTPNLEIPSASQKYDEGVFMVNRPQLTQSNIMLGHLGGRLDSPDYPALSVLNGVLNGFGGRLFNQVRSRQGLAYSVYGVWNPNYDYLGTFMAGGQTRSETTVAFIKSILAEIERLRTTPISEEELANAKDSILNSFVFNFQSPSQTLARLMRYEYFGYPEDFIFKYQEAVKATTVADIQRVAQKYLQPEKIVTLVVGDTETIDPPLSSLGVEVKTVDISIPTPAKS
jgi:zinc protease